LKSHKKALAVGAVVIGLGALFAGAVTATAQKDKKEPNSNWQAPEQKIKENGQGQPRKNLKSETVIQEETRSEVPMEKDTKKPDFSKMQPEKSDSLN